MRKKIVYLILLIAFTACNDFLDEYPSKQSNQPITTTEDLELLLNNVSLDYVPEYNYASMCATDNAAVDVYHYEFQPAVFTYSNSLGWFLWDEYILKNANENKDWVIEFGKIGKANLILDFLDEVEGSPEKKEEIRKEALFIRAYSYFNLVTVYCLPYSQENAQELGLPLRTTISVEQSLKRASLQETYDFIEADLQQALGIRETGPDSPWRCSLPGVQAFAARFYLYLEQYDKALEYAGKALEANDRLASFADVMYQNGQLYNYAGSGALYPYTYAMTSADIYQWPELLYLRLQGQRTYYQHAYPSQKLIDLYSPGDVRFDALFVEKIRVGTGRSPYVGYAYMSTGNYIPSGPTTAEMYLIRAECYARQGDVAQAMQNVEALRQSRFTPDLYQPLIYPAGTKELTQLVIDERNREFPFTLRWYDLHRINRDPLLDHIDIQRTFYTLNGNLPDTGAPLKTYELKAGSRRYAFPITENEIISSGGELEQNTY